MLEDLKNQVAGTFLVALFGVAFEPMEAARETLTWFLLKTVPGQLTVIGIATSGAVKDYLVEKLPWNS